MSEAQPVAPEARIRSLDALRGFALFGVLLINMVSFTGPLERLFFRTGDMLAHPVLANLVILLVQGKFYCLFSFLFGLGFSLQMGRLEARGTDAVAVYRRRLVVLMLIGLLQGVLVWMGDILFAYACFGFLLLAYRRRKDRTLLVWGLCLVGGLALVALSAGLVTWVGTVATPDKMAAAARQQSAQIQRMLAHNVQVYSQGPYLALSALRLEELVKGYAAALLALGPQIFGLFLLGAWTGRRGVVADPPAHRRLVSGVMAWGWPVGLLCTAVYLWAQSRGPAGPGNWRGVAGQGFYMVGAPALALAYAATLLRLWERGTARWLQRHLAPLGRMALTNYLTHSVVCTNLYYFWGTARYGRVGLQEVLGMTALIYGLQIVFSAWWLRRFRMGPMEWVWRRFTYREAPPFRI